LRSNLLANKLSKADLKSAHDTLQILNQTEHVVSQLQGVLRAALELSRQAKSFNVASGFDFYDSVSRFEILLIKSALRQAHGSQVKAAKLLSIPCSTLSTKIKVYRIDWRDFAPGR
jgi:DNA-binding NtrC family response regulator